ncbi:MAG: hypothetical protein HC848_05315, partial [Limnobacter sp.]|nr:hypothetical protein [Limnobacter sp.]
MTLSSQTMNNNTVQSAAKALASGKNKGIEKPSDSGFESLFATAMAGQSAGGKWSELHGELQEALASGEQKKNTPPNPAGGLSPVASAVHNAVFAQQNQQPGPVAAAPSIQASATVKPAPIAQQPASPAMGTNNTHTSSVQANAPQEPGAAQEGAKNSKAPEAQTSQSGNTADIQQAASSPANAQSTAQRAQAEQTTPELPVEQVIGAGQKATRAALTDPETAPEQASRIAVPAVLVSDVQKTHS